MCGINGFNWKDDSLIKEMNEKIKHRGPDFQNSYIDQNISLGHNRLAIIDLSENGNQPMFNKKKNLCIVFNGEIYNFQELKKRFCKDYEFNSKTDTEVILAMYERFGEKCVKYFNGMWAFCIYDLEKKEFFCSRDRLGIKPFYYYFDKSKFIFSSEIKSILCHDIEIKINPPAVSSFLRYRYVLEDETFFKGIKKLMPGYNLKCKSNEIKIYQFWDLKQEESFESFDSSKNKIEGVLNKSIDYRTISDVPIGSILSGGLDSSYISAIIAKKNKEKINTYTVKFEEEGFDETNYAKLVAEKYNTNHQELLIKKEEYINAMKEYLKFKDEPIGVPNEVALYLLFKEIKKTATVVLAGEGADEIFGGYGKIFRSPFDYFKKTINQTNINFLDFFLENYGYFTDEDMNIIKEEYKIDFKNVFKKYLKKCPRDYSDKISYIFLKIHLPGLLLRSDVSSMANAIENRVPFLDYNLVQISYSLPFEYKNKFKDIQSMKESIDINFEKISENKDVPKFILKKIAENIVPNEIINRKKQGFPLPLDKWFGEDYYEMMKKILIDKNNLISHFIDLKKLEELIKQKEIGQKIWMLYSLEIWLQHIKIEYEGRIKF